MPIANAAFALVVLGGLTWKFAIELGAETIARIPAEEDLSVAGTVDNAQILVNRQVDKQHARQLSGSILVVDGLNLWSIVSLVILTSVVVAGATHKFEFGFIPTTYFFQAMSIIALTANDLRLFLVTFELSFVTFGVILGTWGGLSRRAIAERFLIAHVWGASLLMLGLASLAVAVPWMKIEDSPSRPPITYELSTLVYEIQKWATANEFAFQYANEVFPWILVVLSAGFAISFGLFPFHASQTSILSKVPGELVTLYVAGVLPIASLGWWKYVLPLFPEMLIGIDWLILVSTIGGALWGALRALSPVGPREKIAFIFLSLSSASFLGCHSFTRVGMSGAWLMQQQLAVLLCAAMLAWDPRTNERNSGTTQPPRDHQQLSNQTLLLLSFLAALGLFGSGYLIVTDLFRDSPLTSVTMVLVAALCLAALCTSTIGSQFVSLRRIPSCALLLLVVIPSLFPSLLLHQSEHEFARVFRRFESAPPADSAEPDSEDRQSSP